MFKKLKDKKGFTLVELIVVLVILAMKSTARRRAMLH
ncbi:MAG: type II secretion system protein [Subdoligranulum variabile]|nr:type II secretion system protein [Subdoligranulum variabile]